MFDKMLKKDAVSWSAMITGYAQHGHGKDALELFCQMRRTGMKLNQHTFASVLSACVGLSALDIGKQVHVHVIKAGFGMDIFVGSNLVDLYAKCGNIADGRQIFERMSTRDVVIWSAMVAGYAQSGFGEEAIKLFF